VSSQEELDRVLPVVERIHRELDVVISLDTSNPELMRAGAALGAGMINDVRALDREGAMQAAADSGLAVCLMHRQGEPQTMQQAPYYQDVVAEVRGYLARKLEACEQAGMARDRLVIDPGFGFGKNLTHNLTLMAHLRDLLALPAAMLIGVSRKSMVGDVLNKPVGGRLHGSTALAVLAAAQGAHIFRVHDVAPAVDAMRMPAAVVSHYRRRDMTRKYFGTDGVRGAVGTFPISPDFVLRLGGAAGSVFAERGHSKITIGKATRISGYMFESALQAGISAAGVDVLLLGPMP